MARSRTATVLCPILPYPPTSGSAKRTLRLLEAMERAGVTPHLLTPDGSPGAAREVVGRGWELEVADTHPPSVPSRVRQHLARRPSPYIDDIARRLRVAEERPTFVQAEHAMSGYYFAAHPPVPVVLSTQNVDSEMLATIARDARPLSIHWAQHWNRSRAMRTTERRVARSADVVLCVSDADAAHFEGLGASVVLVPNGVDDEVFSVGRASCTESVLFFGRLDYPPNDHGLRRFLEAVWPLVATERPAARLRVVGAGLGVTAARMIAGAPRATALGVVPQILPELAAAAVVVVPVWQGGGTRLKVLEALGSARPVVGTPLGVSGLGVQDGIHASVATTPRDFAAATVRLLGDHAAALELGRNGRALAEGFRWSTTTAPATELYARLSQQSAP